MGKGWNYGREKRRKRLTNTRGNVSVHDLSFFELLVEVSCNPHRISHWTKALGVQHFTSSFITLTLTHLLHLFSALRSVSQSEFEFQNERMNEVHGCEQILLWETVTCSGQEALSRQKQQWKKHQPLRKRIKVKTKNVFLLLTRKAT